MFSSERIFNSAKKKVKKNIILVCTRGFVDEKDLGTVALDDGVAQVPDVRLVNVERGDFGDKLPAFSVLQQHGVVGLLLKDRRVVVHVVHCKNENILIIIFKTQNKSVKE